jgi:formylglycine-generating enzyme required for sulfatase activity
MGSPPNEKDRQDDEVRHAVTLKRGFYCAEWTVTRAQFASFVRETHYVTESEVRGNGAWGWIAEKKTFGGEQKLSWRDPGFAQTDDHPVVCVSWNDAVKFAEWAGRKCNRPFRLPTEAEWEYACRAGTQTPYYFGANREDLAHFANTPDAAYRKATGRSCGIAGDDGFAFTAPCGHFAPNSFGLFDMHGNVFQWIADWYGAYPSAAVDDPTGPPTGGHRPIRGGSWLCDDPDRDHQRCAHRIWSGPARSACNIGIRLVFNVPAD